MGKLLALFGMAAAVMAISACTQNGKIACAPTARVAEFFQVYPIPNATGVPDAPQAIVFAQLVPSGQLSGVQLVLAPPTGPPLVAGPIGPAPSPLPTPNQTPGPGGMVQFVGFSVPKLSPATTYQVMLTGTDTYPPGICSPGTVQFQFGSPFTTL